MQPSLFSDEAGEAVFAFDAQHTNSSRICRTVVGRLRWAELPLLVRGARQSKRVAHRAASKRCGLPQLWGQAHCAGGRRRGNGPGPRTAVSDRPVQARLLSLLRVSLTTGRTSASVPGARLKDTVLC